MRQVLQAIGVSAFPQFTLSRFLSHLARRWSRLMRCDCPRSPTLRAQAVVTGNTRQPTCSLLGQIDRPSLTGNSRTHSNRTPDKTTFFVVRVTNPKRTLHHSPMIKVTSNDGDQAASQISGRHPFSKSGGYPLDPQNAEQRAGVPGRDAACPPMTRHPLNATWRYHVSPTNAGIELNVACAEQSVQPFDTVALDALDGQSTRCN